MNKALKPTRFVGWVFLFALKRESTPFKRRFKLIKSLPDAPCTGGIYETDRGSVVILETGIGAKYAAAAIRWVLENFEPRLVIACGFAGALTPMLNVGDVLVASEVVEPGEDDFRCRTAVPAELGDLPVGRLVTVPQLAAAVADKRALARETEAIAVDMESAAIAEVCQEKRVPCAVVRAISDTADTALSPLLVDLVSNDRWPGQRCALIAFARSPRLAVEIWRLARDTRRAAFLMAEALHRLIE